jgi:recombination protein RecA
MGVIDKRGSFYNYGDERLAQGRENAKVFLRENPPVCDEIELKIRETLGLEAPAQAVDDAIEDDSLLDE